MINSISPTMATKLSTEKVQEFQFHEIPKGTTWENIQRSVWDPSKQEFFGRTKKNWSQLGAFYAIFYTCLAAFFAICMKGMLATLSDNEPKWQLSESLIGTNPGLGFRPISDETTEGSLIWYDLDKPATSQKWIELIDDFLRPYQMDQMGKNYQECSSTQPAREGHVCTVKMDEFAPCTSENNYGYNSSSPCVFLKLNRIFGWVPEYYTRGGVAGMPSDLRGLIEGTNETKVWISCAGEHPFDKERVEQFRYFPSQGFPGYYFPYKNYPNYLSPLVAVQIMNVPHSVIVNIECKAWAKNINYNGNNNYREGSVHFEILVDGLQ